MKVIGRKKNPENQQTVLVRFVPRSGRSQLKGSRSLIVHESSVAKLEALFRKAVMEANDQ
jgi:hypothetical protein